MPPKRRPAPDAGQVSGARQPHIKELRGPILGTGHLQTQNEGRKEFDLKARNPEEIELADREFATGRRIPKVIEGDGDSLPTRSGKGTTSLFGFGWLGNFIASKGGSDPVVVPSTDDEGPSPSSLPVSSLADRLLESDPKFRPYFQRQVDLMKCYCTPVTDARYLPPPTTITKAADAQQQNENSAPQASEVVTNGSGGQTLLVRPHHPRWADLVAQDFLSRRRTFLGHQRATGAVSQSFASRAIKILLPILIAFIAMLAVGWPLWDLLLDVETDVHYSALEVTNTATPKEIKKAYRRLAKKWHPDSNPGCGQPCANMMMKIQKAHDVLLAKGSSETRSEGKRKYAEAVGTLLSFVFYRGVSVAFFSSSLLAGICSFQALGIRSVPNSIRSVERVFHVALHWLIPAFFLLLTVFYVTGLNINILIAVVIGGVSHFSRRKEEQERRKAEGTASSDESLGFREATSMGIFDLRFSFVLIGTAAGAHAFYFALLEQYPRYDWFWFQMLYGVLFLAGSLAEFPPNLWDNHVMMRCFVPQQYFVYQQQPVSADATSSKFQGRYVVTPMTLLRIEFAFVLNDIFAFCSHVAAPFRITLMLVHIVFLFQLASLPWEKPAAMKTSNIRLALKGVSESGRRRLMRPALSDSSRRWLRQGPTGADGDRPTTSPLRHAEGDAEGPPTELLTEEDLGFLSGLDTEAVSWADLPLNHFPDLQHRLKSASSAQKSDEQRATEASKMLQMVASHGASHTGRVAINADSRRLMQRVLIHDVFRGNPVAPDAEAQRYRYTQVHYRSAQALSARFAAAQMLSALRTWGFALAALFALYVLTGSSIVGTDSGEIQLTVRQAATISNAYQLQAASVFGLRTRDWIAPVALSREESEKRKKRSKKKQASKQPEKEKQFASPRQMRVRPQVVTPFQSEHVALKQFRLAFLGPETERERMQQEMRRTKIWRREQAAEKEYAEQERDGTAFRPEAPFGRRAPPPKPGTADGEYPEMKQKYDEAMRREDERERAERRRHGHAGG